MNAPAAGGVVRIPSGNVELDGLLECPQPCAGMVVFAHGSGSSRHSPRNAFVAAELRRAGLATLLMDLLTPAEDRDYARRFDIDILTARLADAVAYLDRQPSAPLPLGVFGASTGAAAALRLAAALPQRVGAVVARGGRVDLAGDATLAQVRAPTLLIVGSLDAEVIELNVLAYRELAGVKQMDIVVGASHLFEEPGALERVARLGVDWFGRHLSGGRAGAAG